MFGRTSGSAADKRVNPCPACGAGLGEDPSRCSRCNWTRRAAVAFRWEFYGSLVIFVLMFAIAFVAVTYMTSVLTSGR